jgi:hypothetical protein
MTSKILLVHNLIPIRVFGFDWPGMARWEVGTLPIRRFEEREGYWFGEETELIVRVQVGRCES